MNEVMFLAKRISKENIMYVHNEVFFFPKEVRMKLSSEK